MFSFEYCENQAAASVKNRTTEIARMHKNVSYKHKKNIIFQIFQVEPKQKFIFLEIFKENVFKSDYFPGFLGFPGRVVTALYLALVSLYSHPLDFVLSLSFLKPLATIANLHERAVKL